MRIDDLLSPQNLGAMVEARIVGDVRPYAGGNAAGVEGHIRATVAQLEAIPGLAWTCEFEHYGSGYASFVDAFASRCDGHGSQVTGDITRCDGLRAYISRVAPLACFGAAHAITHKAGGGSGTFLEPRQLDVVPDPSWEPFVRQIREVLADQGYEIMPADLAAQRLGFTFQTELSDGGPCRLFDVAFFWND